MTEQEIADLLRRQGPRTGAELLDLTGMEVFALWRTCRRAADILSERIGRRYLRLDKAVGGFARLSPSIRREFLTYTVLGHRDDTEALRERAARQTAEAREISRRKITLARESMAGVSESVPSRDELLRCACFVIAGDVVYDMGHGVPRPEPSTGEMVRGSDLDIVVIVADDTPDELLRSLDQAIYGRKHFLLVHPGYREEIDYIIKRLSTVRTQLRFDTFKSMVACKILDEGQLLYGSDELFGVVKALLREQHVPERLAELEAKAVAGRAEAEQSLLELSSDAREAEYLHLFYTSEEREEIY